MDADPPTTCPDCGARDSYRPRYVTGGGWRVVGYRCRGCGRITPPTPGRRAAVAAADHPGLVALAVGALVAGLAAARRWWLRGR